MRPTSYKAGVARAFGNAVAGYDAAAQIQRQVAERLAIHIAGSAIPAELRVLEIGCGTGFLTNAIGKQLGVKTWVVTDLSEAMVRRSRDNFRACPNVSFTAMDGEHPCFTPEKARFDLICSSLTFQWFSDLELSLATLARLLAPGGLLAFATLTAGSFVEWDNIVSARGFRSGLRVYPTVETLRGAMPEGGSSCVTAQDLLVTYPSASSFLSELKQIGAGLPDRDYKPLTPGVLRSILRAHEGPLPITYRLAFGSFQLDT